MSATLELVGIAKTYDGRTALDGVDLDVEAGRVVGLLGANGAGKSTLVSIAAGLLDPDGGIARVCGHATRGSRRDLARHVGLAPQDIGVYPPLTVRQNLLFFGEANGLATRAARQRAAELSSALHLDHLMDRRAGQLSGGEQRRLHTAIALVHRPALVLLDEPTAGSDVETRAALLDVVRRIAADGAAVVYTTHYLPEVEALAADVAILEHGRIIARGTVEQLVAASAQALVLLEFRGRAPRLWPTAAYRDADRPDGGGERVTLPSADPASGLADALARLDGHDADLVGVEIVRPSLEAAYLQLTGRRAAAEVDG